MTKILKILSIILFLSSLGTVVYSKDMNAKDSLTMDFIENVFSKDNSEINLNKIIIKIPRRQFMLDLLYFPGNFSSVSCGIQYDTIPCHCFDLTLFVE